MNLTKTISLGAVPCCDEFKSIAPHGLENFDDIIILDFEVIGVSSLNSNNYMTFTKLKSNNFQILIDDKIVKLIVSHNDTFFKVVYVTITYKTRISIPNSLHLYNKTADLNNRYIKVISNDVSMTGEITLRGKILPVGGIKEKILVAINNNIKTIYVPMDNKADVKEIDKDIIKGIRIKYINNYLELYNDLF